MMNANYKKCFSFILILTILGYSSGLENREQTRDLKSDCKIFDEKDEKLEKELSSMLAKSYELSQDSIIMGYQYFPANLTHKVYNVSVSSSDRHHVIGDKRCSRRDQTRWDPSSNDILLCPHHFLLVNRTDRFPFKVLYAVCNCEDCIQSHTNSCEPIYILRPVLIRQKCKHSDDSKEDLYRWIDGVEKIAIGCDCVEKTVLN